jgi:predicted DNA-binding transcriptional regulator AlpA
MESDEHRYSDLRMRVGVLSEAEIAKMFDMTERTLRIWRKNKSGPKFVKIGRSVFYRLTDIEAWIAEQAKCAPASEEESED